MENEENKDPIMGGEAQGGEGDGGGDTPTPPVPPTPPTPEKKDPVAMVSARLSEEGGSEAHSSVIEEEQAIPFDVTKLSREQLQTLQQMLQATPNAAVRKTRKPQVRLRRIDGNFVVDFKNAYLGLIKDSENRREVERHVIPVKFLGSENFSDVLYNKFINSEQVACEVLNSRQETEEIIEGETLSRETGTMVEMVRKVIRNWYTVKLPDGTELEIEGKIANA